MALLSNISSHCFFELVCTPGVAVLTRHRWPLGDEGKQAKKHRGGSGPTPYPRGGVRSAPLPSLPCNSGKTRRAHRGKLLTSRPTRGQVGPPLGPVLGKSIRPGHSGHAEDPFAAPVPYRDRKRAIGLTWRFIYTIAF